MFQGSLKFQGCFEGVLRVFQGSFKKTFKVFQKSFMLHGTHRSFPSRRRACFLNGYTFKEKFETYQKFYFLLLKGHIGGF